MDECDLKFSTLQKIILKFLMNEGEQPIDIKRHLDKQFLENTLSIETIRCWVREFKEGRSRKAPTTDKLMMTCFWDSQGIVHLEFNIARERIDSEKYCNTLTRLRDKIHYKWPGRQVVFLHDNATCHTSYRTTDLLLKFKWQVLKHPSYSPDLAPSDYFLFGALKDHLRGTHFHSDEELIWAVKKFFKDQTQKFYKDAIHDLPNKWDNCVTKKGEYSVK